MKVCESCGFEMVKLTDFGGCDTSNKYCYRCTDNKGFLKPKKIVLKGMVLHLMRQGYKRSEAIKLAEKELSKHPAWK